MLKRKRNFPLLSEKMRWKKIFDFFLLLLLLLFHLLPNVVCYLLPIIIAC